MKMPIFETISVYNSIQNISQMEKYLVRVDWNKSQVDMNLIGTVTTFHDWDFKWSNTRKKSKQDMKWLTFSADRKKVAELNDLSHLIRWCSAYTKTLALILSQTTFRARYPSMRDEHDISRCVASWERWRWFWLFIRLINKYFRWLFIRDSWIVFISNSVDLGSFNKKKLDLLFVFS